MKLLLIVLSLMAASCSGMFPSQEESARKMHARFTYLQDPATDLCYAYIQQGDSAFGMLTNVPCNEKVLQRLVNR